MGTTNVPVSGSFIPVGGCKIVVDLDNNGVSYSEIKRAIINADKSVSDYLSSKNLSEDAILNPEQLKEFGDFLLSQKTHVKIQDVTTHKQYDVGEERVIEVNEAEDQKAVIPSGNAGPARSEQKSRPIGSSGALGGIRDTVSRGWSDGKKNGGWFGAVKGALDGAAAYFSGAKISEKKGLFSVGKEIVAAIFTVGGGIVGATGVLFTGIKATVYDEPKGFIDKLNGPDYAPAKEAYESAKSEYDSVKSRYESVRSTVPQLKREAVEAAKKAEEAASSSAPNGADKLVAAEEQRVIAEQKAKELENFEQLEKDLHNAENRLEKAKKRLDKAARNIPEEARENARSASRAAKDISE